MTLVLLREKIKDTLKAEVSGIAEAYTHGGRFDQDELKRWGRISPCITVGVLDMPELSHEGATPVGTFEWGAFIVTKDEVKPERKRDVMGLLMLQKALQVITPTQRWDEDGPYAIENIKARNLYSGKIDGIGIALWVITWSHKYELTDFDINTLDNFLTAHADLTPESDNADTPKTETTTTLPPFEETP